MNINLCRDSKDLIATERPVHFTLFSLLYNFRQFIKAESAYRLTIEDLARGKMEHVVKNKLVRFTPSRPVKDFRQSLEAGLIYRLVTVALYKGGAKRSVIQFFPKRSLSVNGGHWSILPQCSISLRSLQYKQENLQNEIYRESRVSTASAGRCNGATRSASNCDDSAMPRVLGASGVRAN